MARIKVWNGSSWDYVGNEVSGAVTESGTQTLTNKDLSSSTNTLPAGVIIQVVSATNGTRTTTTSSTYADTGLTATITPSSTSSRIKVTVSQPYYASSSAATGLHLRLNRGATVLAQMGSYLGYIGGDQGIRGVCGYSYVDSPATTSAVTYKTQLARITGAGAPCVNDQSAVSQIILEEIAG